VNAYTGHSNNAHTAATSYFHLNSKWICHAIASSALSPAVFASADPVRTGVGRRENGGGRIKEEKRDQAEGPQPTERAEEEQMRKIATDILLHQFPQTPLAYLSL
jgi:hypothetical protein